MIPGVPADPVVWEKGLVSRRLLLHQREGWTPEVDLDLVQKLIFFQFLGCHGFPGRNASLLTGFQNEVSVILRFFI